MPFASLVSWLGLGWFPKDTESWLGWLGWVALASLLVAYASGLLEGLCQV
jgi:hypothetical protein